MGAGAWQQAQASALWGATRTQQVVLRAAQAVDAVAGSTTAVVAASVRSDGLVLLPTQ